MINRCLVLFLLLGIAPSSFSQKISADSTRRELIELVKERKILFDAYSKSLKKKSGLFGNKTKNDLRDSQEKLEGIIAIDNKIMNALNRTLQFRNFEKTSMKFDVSEYERRIGNLQRLNDTLNSRNLRLEEENKKVKSAIKRKRLYNVLLIFLLVVTAAALVRKYIKSSRNY